MGVRRALIHLCRRYKYLFRFGYNCICHFDHYTILRGLCQGGGLFSAFGLTATDASGSDGGCVGFIGVRF